MTRDDIIRLAREAAEATNTIVPPEGPLFVTPFIERFAAFVAAAEREACEKLCVDVWNSRTGLETGTALQCVAAIRARGNNGQE